MMLIGLFVLFLALTTINAHCTDKHTTCINLSQQPMSTMTLITNSEIPPPPNVTNHPNLRLLDPNCGFITQQVTTNGNKTGIFEYPWMALIAYDTGKSIPKFLCSGTIISSRYILTAAHCLIALPSSYRLLGVRVGEHDISTERDCDRNENGQELECAEQYRDFGVESVHYHPDYSRIQLHNDIALIRLNSTIDFRSRNVKSICLPYGTAANLTEKIATVTGWRAVPYTQRSQVLLQAKLSLMLHEQCKEVFERFKTISYKQLCAGDLNYADPCVGDGGGPLQAPGIYNGRSVRIIQYGVVSYGLRQCGTEGFPGVYTNVAYYMDWILNTITD